MHNRKYFNTFFSILSYGIAVFLLVSLVTYNQNDMAVLAINARVANMCGPFGVWIADFLRNAFGTAAFLSVPFFIITGLFFAEKINNDYYFQTAFATLLLFFSLSILFDYLLSSPNPAQSGGYIGHYLGRFLQEIAGFRISLVLTIIINGICIFYSGILTLIGRWSVSMRSLLKDFITKTTDESATGKVPLARIEKKGRTRKASRPWITRRTVTQEVGTKSRSQAEKNGQSIDPIEPVMPLDMSFNETLSDIPAPESPVSLSLSQSEIEVEDRRIFMRDAILDLHVLDSHFNEAIPASSMILQETASKPCTDTEDPGHTFQQTESSKAGILQAIERKRHDTVGHIQSATAYADSPDDEEPSYAEQSRTIASGITAVPEEADEAVYTDDEVAVSGTVWKEDELLSAQTSGTFDDESADGDDPEERNRFHTFGVNREYIIPSYFFNMSPETDTDSIDQEIDRNSELLVKTLKDFGIQSKVVNVNRGPVITLYEIQIAAGIKVNKVSALADDIAMALAASRVRILAPIPGKSAVGVEIPNINRDMVSIGDILNDPVFLNAKMQLKIGLGKDILGKPVMLDLKRMPHLLIAGATGSGKSVCVNTIVSSLVFCYDPDRVRFIMIDPKMVELQLYNGLPHQLTPVITDPDIAPKALKWAIYEMERRYRLLSELHTRDIERYNQKIESYNGKSDLEKLPYIVIIVDELADLMMVAPKEIENYITRIAQKARAVGIHLVLATQRPSVDVITGIIKANFPARIAFQVAQKTDSRTIIDQNGAETLLGRGDMLYQSPLSSFPVRIQGAFISEDEIIDMVRHAQKFGHPHYIDIEEEVDQRESSDLDSNDVEQDELFVEALKIIEESRKASASYLQRRLSIGYNRAARMIERMEELGYVGPPQGSKPREVLV
ncbi:MAG: DNA translocase FtsK 4TM domain-containing protein [Spirochaetota bacterium]